MHCRQRDQDAFLATRDDREVGAHTGTQERSVLVFDDDLYIEGHNVALFDSKGCDTGDAPGEEALGVRVDTDLDCLVGLNLTDLRLVDGANYAQVR